MVEDPKTFAERGREQPRPRRRADHGKRPELVSKGAGVRTLFDHEVDAEVLHRRIQELLNSPRQPMDLIDEQYVTGLQVGQDAHQVAAALQRRPGGRDDVRAHLVSDHVRQRRLAQPGGPVQQDVVARLGALFGGLDADPQAFHDLGLADAFVQRLRAEAADKLFVCRRIGDRLLVGWHAVRLGHGTPLSRAPPRAGEASVGVPAIPRSRAPASCSTRYTSSNSSSADEIPGWRRRASSTMRRASAGRGPRWWGGTSRTFALKSSLSGSTPAPGPRSKTDFPLFPCQGAVTFSSLRSPLPRRRRRKLAAFRS